LIPLVSFFSLWKFILPISSNSRPTFSNPNPKHSQINPTTFVKMVHLNAIAKDNEINKPLVKGMEKLDINNSSMNDTFTTTVYGSRFAAEDLPKHEMPECEMPKEVAYRMIKDDLSLDGNPMLKYVLLLLFLGI
jgi:hypothetical protein